MALPHETVTQFPNLLHYVDEELGESGCNDILLEAGIANETIVLAWALLLKGFTEVENPIFALNDEHVSVDTTTREVVKIGEARWGKRPTRVYLIQGEDVESWHESAAISKDCLTNSSSSFPGYPSIDGQESFSSPDDKSNTPRSVKAALALSYYTDTGFCRLETSGGLPVDFLPEICCQIRCYIATLLPLTEESAGTGDLCPIQAVSNAYPTYLEGPQLLHELVFRHNRFEERAIEFRNSDSSETVLSYNALRQYSICFARKLRHFFDSLDAISAKKKRRIVPVLIPQSAELYIALLGILQAGAAFCPINMDTPHDRLKFIVNDLSADVIVTLTRDISKFESVANLEFCALDGLNSLVSNESCSLDSRPSSPIEDLSHGLQPQDTAYVMYTSGSTGQPKGVILSHRAVSQSLLSHDSHIPKFSRFLQFASPTFDVSMFEIFFTLVRGCTLVGCHRTELLNDLPGVISQLNIDAAELTPTVAGTLLRTREDVPSLALLLTIGEMLTKSVIEEFGSSQRRDGILYGMYGPTEAAIHCTLESEFNADGKVGLIGKPLSTVSTFIAEPVTTQSNIDSLRIIPIGHVGELVLGGNQLADGYLNRAEQTEKVFFQHSQHGMLYRTGDKARMLPSGNIECLGRIQSGQIKLRGQRIELGEIEQAAMELSGCRLAVASVINENLILFCLTEGDLSYEQIEAACRKWLLPHMMPNEILLHSAFPKLPSGKVDRKSLEATYNTEIKGTNRGTESSTNSYIVQQICDIAKSILECEIHSDTDLMKAGLDSLRAIRLAAKIRKQRLLKPGAADILNARSIHEICSNSHLAVEPSEGVKSSSNFDNIRSCVLKAKEIEHLSDLVEDVTPCTRLQSSMLAETTKDAQAYCNWIQIAIDRISNLNIIVSSFERLFETHEMLRSGFISVDDPSVGFARVIWKERAEDQLIWKTNNLEYQFQISKVSDLLRPIRISISQETDETLVTIQLHHALYDGWSFDLLLRDLDLTLAGLEIPLRPGFRKVVEYFDQVNLSPSLDNSRDYWKNLLEDFHPPSFPDYFHRASDFGPPSYYTATHEISVKNTIFDTSVQFHTQVYIQTAIVYLWATYLGSNDVTIGTISSGRMIALDNIEEIIGPCISTLPLRVRNVCFQSIRDLMLGIQDQNRQALEHSLVSLKDIKRLASLTPNQTIFDIVFVWQESLESGKGPFNYLREVKSYDYLESKIFIESEPQPGSIKLKCSQRREFLPVPQIDMLLCQVGTIVSSLLKRVQTDSLDVPITSLGSTLSQDLLSVGKLSEEDSTKAHSMLQCENMSDIESVGTIISDPRLSPDRYILPCGAIGIFCLQDPQPGFWNLDKVELQYKSETETRIATNDICRMLPNRNVQLLGKPEDIKILNSQMFNLHDINASVKRLPFVLDCWTVMISQQSHEILLTLWSPLKSEDDPELLGWHNPGGNFLPATKSNIESASKIFEHLHSLQHLNLIPSFALPFSISSSHDMTMSNVIESFNGLSDEEYLTHFSPFPGFEEDISAGDKLDLEQAIIKSLAELLQIPAPRINRTASFFRLGLDSISAIALSRKLRAVFQGTDINVSKILKYPTAGSLTSHLVTEVNRLSQGEMDRTENSPNSELLEEIAKSYELQGYNVKKVNHCTPLQEAMLAAPSSTYNNHTLFETFTYGSRFRSALFKLCKRHDILRTIFSTTTNMDVPFVQVILKDPYLPWRDVSCNHDDIDMILSDNTAFQFDPLKSTSLPFLITEIKSSGRSYLLFSFHHALYDGEAMSQLLWEVEQIIKGVQLPETPDYDLFLEKILHQNYEGMDEFWRSLFSGFQPTYFSRLDTDDTSVGRQSYTSSVLLENSLTSLERLAQEQAATLGTLCQAALAKVLSAILGTTDVCFGNVVNGRSISVDGIEELVGPCFNTVPVRIHLAPEQTNGSVIQNLQAINAEILAYQFASLRRIKSILGISGERLFDTLFLLQKPLPALDESIWTMKKDVGDMGLPLVCEIIPRPKQDQIRVHFHSDQSFISEQMCIDVTKAFSRALACCVEKPDVLIDKPYVELLDHWNTEKPGNSTNEQIMSCNAQYDHGKSFTLANENIMKVRRIFSNFTKLQMDEVPNDESLFRLGLDSVNAIQLAKLMRNEGLNLSSEDIMKGRSAAGIATLLQEDIESPFNPQQLKEKHFDFKEFDASYRSMVLGQYQLRTEDISSVRPCTQLQTGIISQYLNSAGQMYLNRFTLELSQDLDLGLLHKAWDLAFENHDMLRTGFASLEDARYPFVMITYEPGVLSLPWTEIGLCEQEFATYSNTESVKFARNKLAENTFQNLHTPPWHLTLVSNTSDKQRSILELTALHALYDAASLQMIFQDVRKFYRSNNVQSSNSIEPLLGHILDRSNDEDSHRQFWTSTLQGMPMNRFPNLNPLRVDMREVKEISSLNSELQAFEEGCRFLGVTIQAALQVAWARLLSDYLAEEDVTFGVIFSGRESDGAEEILFPSSTTVPCRINVQGDMKVMLQKVMDYNVAVRKHQHISLPTIARWASYDHSSTFDTILVYQPTALEETVEDIWKLSDEQATVEYPLSLEIIRCNAEHLRLRLVFWDDIIPLQHAHLLLDQFIAVFRHTTIGKCGLYDTPFRSMENLSKLPPKMSEIPAATKTLHELVQHSAKLYPDRIALEFAPMLDTFSIHRWTYEELDLEGNKVANMILQSGVKRGALIAICFDKSAVASFVILGILKAGCAFVAIDPSAPNARKDFIVQDSEALLLFTTSDLAQDLEVSVKILSVDSMNGEGLSTYEPETSQLVQKKDRCYCLYTSGSSGQPKGCVITHENAVQAILSFQSLFDGRWDSHSRWLQFASFHFDVSVLEQFWSWSVGICVVSTPRDILFSDLAGSLRKLNITHIDLTPSLARLITPQEVPSLCKGIFITGGEPLKQEVLDVWGSSGVIHNGYGPTECTIGCTMYPRVPSNGKPSNIGWQFDNVGTYVFRSGTNELVPRGAVGELCISGKLVGDGYLKRPDLTQESFTYIDKYDEKVYRTKDLVRMLHDGSFEFLGRNDDQVKLRGQRLELGEINYAIKTNHKQVQEATTIVTKLRTNQSEQLVCFVVLDALSSSETSKEDQARNKEDFRKTCEAKLPSYMVPAFFLLLEELPLTANNKVDVHKLKTIFDDYIDADCANNVVQKQNSKASPEESKVAQVVADFLSVPYEAITPRSNLFELGLDSISSFGLARALQRKGFDEARATTILKYQNIRGLSEALKSPTPSNNGVSQARHNIEAFQRRHKAFIARNLDLSVQKLEGVFPCTPLQEGMIAKALQNDSKPYFNSLLYAVDHSIIQNFDSQGQGSSVSESRENHVSSSRQGDFLLQNFSESLAQAFQDAVASAPILLSKFIPTHEGYAQVLVEGADDELCITEELVTSKTFQAVIDEHRDAWLKINSDTFTQPLQIRILRDTERRKVYVLLNIFHALYDANSLSILLGNVAEQVLESKKASNSISFYEALPYGPLQIVEGAETFWKSHLTLASFRPLPVGSENPHPSSHSSSLKLKDIHKFESVRRKLNVTHQALIQAAWMAAFQEWRKGSNTIGMVVSGRSINIRDADRIIGPMFNTIPFSLKISEHETWTTLSSKCHEFNVSSIPFHHTPLREIQKWHRASHRKTLFDSLFVFQKYAYQEFVGESSIFKEIDRSAFPDYPLAFEAEQLDSSVLKVTIVVQDDIADIDTCNHLLQRFGTIFNRILENPDEEITTIIDTSILQDGDYKSHAESDYLNPAVAHETGFIWTEVATIIREKVAEISGYEINSIDEHTSIYQLGLDSIDAIRLSSVMKTNGYDLSVSVILRQQSVRNMSEVIKPNVNSHVSGSKETDDLFISNAMKGLMHLKTRDVTEILPATPLQESIVSEMISSNFRTYFNHDILRLRADTNMDQLKMAWLKVVQDRPILRACFFEVKDPDIPFSFVQAFKSEAKLNWECLQLSHAQSLNDVLHNIENTVAASNSKFADSIDVTGLLKLTAVVDQTGERYIILSISHALYDGWSLSLLHQDISNAYYGELETRPNITKALSKILRGENTDSKNFWTDLVSGFHGCRFPLAKERNSTVHRFERHSTAKLDDIRTFCKGQNIGLQALGHLCWASVLSMYTKKFDVGFGVVLAGRDTEEAQHTMFPTMNTVLVRLILSGSRSYMLGQIQSNLANVMQHQYFPLRGVSALSGLRGLELFNTLFIYQKRPPARSNCGSLYESVETSSQVEYPVCVEMEIVEETLIWRNACSDGALSLDESSRLLERLDQVLENIILFPEALVMEFNEDNSVSACGLPVFSPHGSQGSEHPAMNGHMLSQESVSSEHSVNGDKNYNETRSIVNEALSIVSKIPENQIREKDTIYHLGLDSISLIKVVSILRRKNIHISVGEILKAGEVGAIILAAAKTGSTQEVGGVDLQNALNDIVEGVDVGNFARHIIGGTSNIERTLPATAAQVFFISHWQSTNGELFDSMFEYQLQGSLEMQALQRAWDILVERNEILRTTFASTRSKSVPIVQIVMKSVASSFVDVDRKDPSTSPQRLTGSLVRLKARRISDESIWLGLQIHHALYDAVSLPLLVQQLEQLCYNPNSVTGQTSGLAFATYIALTHIAESQDRRRSFWTQYLESKELWHSQKDQSQQHLLDLSLRTNLYRPKMFTDVGRLMQMLRQKGLSFQSLFIAAVAQLYCRLKGKKPSEAADVVIGVYLANRSHRIPQSGKDPQDDLAHLAAPTVNLVPLVVESPLEKTRLFCAAQVQDHLEKISTFENATVSLWEIDEWTGVKIDCFVNFLALPEEESRNKDSANYGEAPQRVSIRPSNRDKEDFVGIDQKRGRKPGVQDDAPMHVSNNGVADTYVPSWDIEAAVRDGALDIGIFGPERILDKDKAIFIVDDLKKQLGEILLVAN